MSLETVYFVSQIVAVIGILASLLFVGVQISRNTAATRAASHHAISDALNRINYSFAENADVTEIFLKGRENRDQLTTEERWRFDAIMRAYFHICETMFFQAQVGAGDEGILSAEENAMKFMVSSAGGRSWWDENTFGFDEPFRNYVTTLTAKVGDQ